MATEGHRFTAPRVRALVGAGFQALDERRQEINDLNVYPVPDGDTGTNLALTIRSVMEELALVPDDAPPDVLAGAIGRAALMGARGNSGVILSQMVRGAMEVFRRQADVDDGLFAEAFHQASDAAYRAIRKPVEGTMLTVLREMKDEAEARAQEGNHRVMMEQVLQTGWESVRRTQEQLRVLAEAGVVDAGGFGLLVFLEGLIAGAEGPEIAAGIDLDRLAGRPEPAAEPEVVGDFTYCTSFLLTGTELVPADLERALSDLGDSLLVVGDAAQVKVHIHTNEPGDVLSLATARGSLSGIAIDNMRLQTAARSERLGVVDLPGPADADAPAPFQTEVVAVVAGAGNERLFESLGATRLVEGGQSMNPSAEELLEAVEATSAPTVVILPNNKNVVLAAEQVCAMTGRDVRVVPTRSIQAGLAAMVVFDAGLPGDDNVEAMLESLAELRTAEVTRAVRDSRVNGLEILEGAFLGLVDGEVVVSESDLSEAVRAVAEHLVNGQTEVLTILLGDEDEPNAPSPAEVVERLRSWYPDLEIEVHEGGQPLYPLLLSAE